MTKKRIRGGDFWVDFRKGFENGFTKTWGIVRPIVKALTGLGKKNNRQKIIKL